MKKNLFIKILALTLSLLMLASCGSNGGKTADINKAVWEDYQDMPFSKLLKNGLTSMFDDENVNIKVTSSIGWKDAEDLDESDIEKGNTAVSYTVKMSDDSDSITVTFFMEMDKEGILYVHGGKGNNPNGVSSIGKTEAEALQKKEAFDKAIRELLK